MLWSSVFLSEKGFENEIILSACLRGRQADKPDFTRGYMICLEDVDSLLWAGVCLQKNAAGKT
ncbi:hypothetical protein NEISUBOT_05428 [Neisseria subflava NJ9703]|uniref:Uncharacterized protein n=1 Tax=Neisseria subflava NJ9703 TaxID=546268 RepID=A0A9W5MY82_NEISU|nr:hypothetical protein NEISUBOT_05428 [Neisseria subflava NJ9703]